jgi:hypothetical protein
LEDGLQENIQDKVEREQGQRKEKAIQRIK